MALLVITIAWSGFRLIQFNQVKRLELQKLQQEKQQLLKQSEEQQQLKQNLEKQLQDKDAEIKKLKEAKLRSATVAYASSSMSEQEALNWISSREGGATSVNKSSLACGLAQSLPCSKVLSFAGVDLTRYNLNTYEGVKAAISTVPVETQREWMRQYCIRRYGSVQQAVEAWKRQGWY